MNVEQIINFIDWIRDTHNITLEEWYGPESDEVAEEELRKYITDYLEEGTYEN